MRRRAEVKLTPPTGPPSTTTRSWNWAGADGEEEVEEDGRTTSSVGPFRLGEGTSRFGHDALGSVTSQNDGFGAQFAEFSSWGQLNAIGTLQSSAGFAGGRVEAALGLNYNRRRWQDPISGIFLSRDEIGAGNYLNSPNALGAWSYAANNPERFADPDGRDPETEYCTRFATRTGADVGRCLDVVRRSKHGPNGEFEHLPELTTFSVRYNKEYSFAEQLFNFARDINPFAKLGWFGAQSYYESKDAGRGTISSIGVGLAGGTGARGLIEGVALRDLATGLPITYDEALDRSVDGAFQAVDLTLSVTALLETPHPASPTNLSENVALPDRFTNTTEPSWSIKPTSAQLPASEQLKALPSGAAPTESPPSRTFYVAEDGSTFIRRGTLEPIVGEGVLVTPEPERFVPPSGESPRESLMGRTPDKFSKTGRDVVERMRNDGLIRGEGPLLRGNPNNLELRTATGWVRIDETIDMAHTTDAVTWWNENRFKVAPKSQPVREFMLDSNSYTLQQQGPNRSAGAKLGNSGTHYLAPIITTFK